MFRRLCSPWAMGTWAPAAPWKRVTEESSPVRVESGIDGRRRNLDRLPAFPSDARFHPEVKWEKWALTRHLEELGRTDDDGMLGLQMRTIESGITLAAAGKTVYAHQPLRTAVRQGYEWISEESDFDLGEGETVQLDKLVVYLSSRDSDEQLSGVDHLSSAEDLDGAARQLLAGAVQDGFDDSLAAR